MYFSFSGRDGPCVDQLSIRPLTRCAVSKGKTGDGVEEKPHKHVRVDATGGAAKAGETKMTYETPQAEKRVVTMEPSVRSFAGPSSVRRDRSDAVMITDALADVRVK